MRMMIRKAKERMENDDEDKNEDEESKSPQWPGLGRELTIPKFCLSFLEVYKNVHL